MFFSEKSLIVKKIFFNEFSLFRYSYILPLIKVFLILREERASILIDNFLSDLLHLKNISGLNFYCGRYKKIYIGLLIDDSDIDTITTTLLESTLIKPNLIIKFSYCIPTNEKVLSEEPFLYLPSSVFYREDSENSEEKIIKEKYTDQRLIEKTLELGKKLNLRIKSERVYSISKDESDFSEVLKNLSINFLDRDSFFLHKSFYKKNFLLFFTPPPAYKNEKEVDKNIENFKNIMRLALELSIRYT